MGNSNTLAGFNVDVTITDGVQKRKLYLKAKYEQLIGEDHGNSLYLRLDGRGETKFQRLFDISNENVDPTRLEVFLLSWIYSFWSGSNGSWDVYKVVIESINIVPKSLLKTDINMI